MDRSRSLATTVSVPALIDRILDDAQAKGASDIHFDPCTGGMRMRVRIDGVLSEVGRLPLESRAQVISRIKVLSGLRTDEHQAAQDGRFRHTGKRGASVDVPIAR